MLFVAVRDLGDWVTAWPIPKRQVAAEVPQPIRGAFEDALTSLSVGSFAAAF